jgi:hypothetical protein
MVEKKDKSKNTVKDISFRVAKATVKAILIYLVYFLVAPLLAPFLGLIPGIMESIELFVMITIVLMILSDLTEHTILQYFFNTARALFTIAYILFSMGDGVFNMSYQNFSITINLVTFYAIAMGISLLGFASTILQAINFMSERAEASVILPP